MIPLPPLSSFRFCSFRRSLPLLALALAALPAMGAEWPRVLPAGTVAPDVVLVTIRAQRVEHGRQVPYVRQPGDNVADDIHRWVRRDGKLIGALAGAEGKLIFTCDELRGEPLDVAWAGRPGSYRLRSSDDARFSAGITPQAVHRKSLPFDFCRTADEHGAPQDHFLYLRLPVALAEGKHYTVEFVDGKLAAAAADLAFDSTKLRSDAVHVSQIGFRPDDPVKVAFLSCWMGDGGGLSYAAEPVFSVINEKDGRPVLTGKVRVTKRASEGESGGPQNHQKTDVYEMDFSALSAPGSYRVSVAGVGCSRPFAIAADAWTKAFYVSVRGVFHQRSGIALGPPYTGYRRPRAFHPDDGVKVYHTTYAPGEGGGEGGGFKAIVAGRTDAIVPNAWGGYMDAGDWDRRPIHAYVPRLLFDLYEMAPRQFDQLNLNLPESQDDLPDLLNEALWFVDFHRRIQLPDGGIRPGIESAEHPRRGEASWQESLTVMAYAPTANMSYKYAAVAAHAAHVLGQKWPERARGYAESALRAFQWAEQQRTGSPAGAKDGERVLAVAELFQLTGEAKWHDLYLAATRFADAKTAVYSGHKAQSGIYDPQDEAGWVYVRTNRPGISQAVKDNFRRALLANADARLDDIAQSAFRWVATKGKAIAYSGSVIPDAVGLVRAHHLSHEEKYLKGAVLACQQGIGANPLNLCYTTGVGVSFQQHMVHEDYYVSHQPLPPGLTVNGPFDPRNPVLPRHAATVNAFRRFIYPEAKTWPALESYFDVGVWSPMSEFTVHRNIAPTAYVWGYLALGR
jgi:endoglucanase